MGVNFFLTIILTKLLAARKEVSQLDVGTVFKVEAVSPVHDVPVLFAIQLYFFNVSLDADKDLC